MTPAGKLEAAVHGPYEDLAIAAIGLLGKLIDGQTPAVKAQLWQWYIEDMKAWREFWKPPAAEKPPPKV